MPCDQMTLPFMNLIMAGFTITMATGFALYSLGPSQIVGMTLIPGYHSRLKQCEKQLADHKSKNSPLSEEQVTTLEAEIVECRRKRRLYAKGMVPVVGGMWALGEMK